MARHFINGSLLQVFLTSTGYVALSSQQMNKESEAALFGSDGDVPPKKFSVLVNDMLAGLKTAPSNDDADDLAALRSELEISLERVNAAIANRDN